MAPAKPRQWIFDRRSSGGCARALEEAGGSLDPGRRWAVAQNWQMDHRVSPERESGDLRRHLRGVTGVDDWWERRSLYFREELCRTSHSSPSDDGSAYLRATNGSNSPARVAGFDRLVHLGSLNATLWWLSRGPLWADVTRELRRLSGVRFALRPRGLATDWFERQVDRVAEGLLARGEDTVRQAVGYLADASGETEPPWWACFSEEIQDTLHSGSAADVCAALGLGHRRPGEWLVVWDYRVDEALPIYRPTVLEANDSPYHFPSPPEYPFGITMPLSPGTRACREVLHPPLKGPLAAERCTGRLLQLATFPAPSDNPGLARLRALHRGRLQRDFSTSGLAAWLRRHTSRSRP